MSSPAAVALVPSRSRTSAGHGHVSSSSRTSHLVSTLLTFWPPAPARVGRHALGRSSCSALGGSPLGGGGAMQRPVDCEIERRLSEILPPSSEAR